MAGWARHSSGKRTNTYYRGREKDAGRGIVTAIENLDDRGRAKLPTIKDARLEERRAGAPREGMRNTQTRSQLHALKKACKNPVSY